MTQTLCSVDEVKKTIDTVGRWTDTQIVDMITIIDDLIHIESGTPIQHIWSPVSELNDVVQTRYYVGEENIYRVDTVLYGTASKTEATLTDDYKTNYQYGMIEFLPVASSGITLTTKEDIDIRYVPKIYNQLSLYRTCQALLEQVDMTSGGEMSKELEVIMRKVEMVETLLAHRVGVQLSSDVKYYDAVYGVNKKKIIQDPDKNSYVNSSGFS